MVAVALATPQIVASGTCVEIVFAAETDPVSSNSVDVPSANRLLAEENFTVTAVPTATLPKFAPVTENAPPVERECVVAGAIAEIVGSVYVSVFVVGVITQPLSSSTVTAAVGAAPPQDDAPGTFATAIDVPRMFTTPV